MNNCCCNHFEILVCYAFCQNSHRYRIRVLTLDVCYSSRVWWSVTISWWCNGLGCQKRYLHQISFQDIQLSFCVGTITLRMFTMWERLYQRWWGEKTIKWFLNQGNLTSGQSSNDPPTMRRTCNSFQGSSDDNTQQCIFSSVLLRVIYLSDCFFCEMSTDTGFS